jgi:hypothetical protein
MRTTSLHVLLVILCCRVTGGLASEQAPQLDIFLLSEQPLQDYRLIDTPAYPKLGYVAPRPDLVIRQLSAVSTGVAADGDSTAALELRLTNSDAEALEKFSATHIGKRIVFMLGARPLFAPLLRTPLSTQTVQIKPPAGADVQELKRELEALVSKGK